MSLQSLSGSERLYYRVGILLACTFLIGGMLFCFLLPPFQVPDEASHWHSAYARSSALDGVSGTGSDSSDCNFANALPYFFDSARIAFFSEQKMTQGRFAQIASMARQCTADNVSYGSAITYPGALAARVVIQDEERSSRAALRLYYLSRMFQGLLPFMLLLRAVVLWRRSEERPNGLLTLLAFSLSPIALQQSFALSADTVLIALAIQCGAAALLWPVFTVGDRIALIALAIIGAVSKPPFYTLIPVLAAALFLGGRGSDRRRQLLWCSALLILPLAGALWMLSMDHTPPAAQIAGRKISIPEQVEYVKSNPAAVFNTVHAAVSSHLEEPWSRWRLGWLDTEISPIALRAFRAFAVGGLVIDLYLSLLRYWGGRGGSRNLKHALAERLPAVLLLFGSYGTALVVTLAVYVFWSTVGGSAVEGLQLRHLWPVFMLLPLCAVRAVYPSSSIAVPGPCSSNRFRGAAESLLGAAILIGVGITVLSFLYGIAFSLLARYW